MSSHYQIQINKLNTRITAIDTKIAEVQEESYGSGNVQTCCNNYITKLTELKTELEEQKSELQSKETNRQAQLQAIEDAKTAWTTEEQTIIDSINTLFNNKYSKRLESKIKRADTTSRNNFFTHYGEATTDLQKELVLKDYLNIDDSKLF